MMTRAACLAIGTLLAAGSAAAATVFRGTNANGKMASKTRADMQPDVVARTLSQVETEWSDEASEFLECNDTADEAKECGPTEFKKSCPKVVSAIVQASSGDKTVVGDYMKDVCGQTVLGDWQREECKTLATSLTDFMTADSYDNRENFDGSSFCLKFWTTLAKAEADHTRAEREERKRVKEEAEKERKAEAQKLLDAENAAKLEEQKKADEAEALRREEEKKAEEEQQKVKAQVMALKANNTANLTDAQNKTIVAAAPAKAPAQDIRRIVVGTPGLPH